MTTRHESAHPPIDGISGAAAEAWIPKTCFKHGPPRRIGIELELLVHDSRDPRRPTDGTPFDPFRRAALALPVAGGVTVEPGGQIEISSTPHNGLPSVLAEVAGDLQQLRGLATDHGAVLTGLGVDERTVHRRVRTEPRYAGMEAYLDRWGSAGRTMMRRTASLQVNLEASDGTAGDQERRWAILHAVGPPLVATFANSPRDRAGPWKGWACSRMGVWLALDPARTRPPRWRPGSDPARAWARWCLDAPLMLVRRPRGPWTAPTATFREWIDGGRAVVPDRPTPRFDDLAYHLTTLFPPVRARGHLEVRYVDAQPGQWWPVPVAVLWALVTDPDTTTDVLSACTAVRGRWREASRNGLADDALAAAALRLMDIAAASLDGEPATAACADLVRRYRAHWTARRRSPADDRAEGRPVPPAPAIPAPRLTASTLPATVRARKDRPC